MEAYRSKSAIPIDTELNTATFSPDKGLHELNEHQLDLTAIP